MVSSVATCGKISKKDKVDLLDHADYVTFCIGTNDALLPFEFFVMQYEDYFYGYSGCRR